MEESTISQNPPGTSSSSRVGFYDKFKREADENDGDFLNKYGGDADITLIFAGLFSAVSSAFILAIQMQLQPDYTQLSYDVLVLIANQKNLSVASKPSSDSPWAGPDPTLVRVQAILFASLATSILAAFLAMLGKQWLNRYSQVDMRGSLIDRCRDRQRKMDGVATWRFNLVMESLPVLLQLALLLFGCALSKYLFTIDSVVAWVVVGFTAFGVVLYILFAIAATLSYNCPFQTPLSLAIRFIICLDHKHTKLLKKTRTLFRRMFSRTKKQSTSKSGGSYYLGNPSTSYGNNSEDKIEMALVGPFDPPPTLFDRETDWDGYVLDSNCIAWMFEMSMNAEVILDILTFIPDVVWHSGIQITPIERLYDTMLECFDCSSGRPVVIHKLKQKAYLSAKALLHVVVQRRHFDRESDKTVFNSISNRHQQLGSKHHGADSDSDLESTLGIIDRVFKPDGLEEMPWKEFSFTDSHHAWLGRIILYRASYVLGEGNPFPDEIRQFVLYSLRLNPPPPPSIVSDCLRIVSLVLGVGSDINDQQVVDQSQIMRSQIDLVYQNLATTFQNPISRVNAIDRALEALTLVTPLSEGNIAEKSYGLFHTIMQASVSPIFTEQKKWEASRLALHGAYKQNKILPPVVNPQHILTFLDHHFQLAFQGNNQDQSIQNALRALAYASSPTSIKALKSFNPLQLSFTRGIRDAFKKNKPLQLRSAALFFLPLIGDKLFDTHDQIISPNEMGVLCKDWASTVDDVGLATKPARNAALSVFLGMMNSQHWRPHIVAEKWKLLEHFNSVPKDSEPLKRCIENPELIRAISQVGGRDAAILWSTILLLKYGELIPRVREQLEQVTSAAPRSEIDQYLKVMESESIETEDALTKHTTWSTDPEAVALKAKIENVRGAKEYLKTLKGG